VPQYLELANFTVIVTYDGINYPHTEAAFQAQKFVKTALDLAHQFRQELLTQNQALDLATANRSKRPNDWFLRNVSVMEAVVSPYPAAEHSSFISTFEDHADVSAS